MSTQNKSTSTQPSPRPSTKPLTPQDRAAMIEDAAKQKAVSSTSTQPSSGQIVAQRGKQSQPWQDLEPEDKQITPRDGTVFAVALACMDGNNGRTLADGDAPGATLDEIKEAFRSLPGTGPGGTMVHHDPATLLRWQSKNRGWGFAMDQKTGRVRALRK